MKGFTTKRGFTLIEAMIAVTILTLSVAGPLYTANSAIVASMIARDQLIASYLAQEGIEYVRAMRDYQYLAAYNDPAVTDKSGTAWSNFLTGDTDQPGAVTRCRTTTCTLDITRNMGYGSGSALCRSTGGECGSGSTKLYLLDDGDGKYRYATDRSSSSGTATAFSRAIQVIDIPGTESNPLYPDKRVVSTVSWLYHGVPRSVEIYDHLTPWQ